MSQQPICRHSELPQGPAVEAEVTDGLMVESSFADTVGNMFPSHSYSSFILFPFSTSYLLTSNLIFLLIQLTL